MSVRSSGAMAISSEKRAEAQHAVANPRLHGTERHAFALGDLTVRKTLEIGDLDRAPLFDRQELLEGGAQPGGPFSPRHHLVRLLRGHLVADVEDLFGLGPVAHTARTALVDRHVPDEPE